MKVLDVKTGKESSMSQEVIMVTNWVIDFCKKKSKSKYYNFYGFNAPSGFVRDIWNISFKTDHHGSENYEFMFKDCNGYKYSVEYNTKYSFICLLKL